MYHIILLTRVNRTVQFRHDLADICVTFCTVAYQLFKLTVQPYDLPVFKQNRIRNCQFLQQRILYNAILRSKFDQILYHQRVRVQIHNRRKYNIDQHKYTH